MKTFRKALLLLSIMLLFGTGISLAQTTIENIPLGRYLVIGSFNIKKNAIGFAEYVRKKGEYDVKLAYHPPKKLYRVYIKSYSGNETGYEDVRRMRRETEFVDVWSMVVTPYKVNGKVVGAESVPPQEDKSIEATDSKTTVAASSTSDSAVTAANADVEEKPLNEQRKADETSTGESGWVKASNVTTAGNLTQAPEKEVELEAVDPFMVPATYRENGRYKLFFNTFYTKNFKEVKGPVEIINPTSLRLLKTEQSQELVYLDDPNNGTHSLQLIANIFGYKKVQHDINLEEPLDSINIEFFSFKGDTLVADFPLRRYDTGEIATMYNVFFFKDAVIMKPISKFELNSLVEMLKENERLRIKIHGHTNGNAPGKIILLPEGSEDYFTMSADVIEDKGSAKELSLRRAEIIRRYLISYGIDESRMEVIGWGGKKPIYDKYDKLAIKNVRVEIEILEQ